MAVFSGTLGSWPSESSLWREFSIDASGAGAGARGENTRRAVRRVLSRTDDVMSSTNVAPRRKFDRPVVAAAVEADVAADRETRLEELRKRARETVRLASQGEEF